MYYEIGSYVFAYLNFLSGTLTFLISVCALFIPLTGIVCLLLRWWIQNFTAKNKKPNVISVAFFHPYCNAGGGGERVLWTAIRAVQMKYPTVDCYVYSGDTDATEMQILDNVTTRLNITLPRSVHFIFLKKRKWVEAYMYPYFTLLGQSLGSMYLGLEALLSFVPDIYIDSMGYAFTLPLFKYFGSSYVACYVHYPTISTDMLDKVVQGSSVHNNKEVIARSPMLTMAKIWYYRIFAAMYGLVGRCSDVIMVNSTWTKNHINSIWNKRERTYLVYPPCDIDEFQNIPLEERCSNSCNILSIAQFRPEKDHPLQVRTLYTLLQRLPKEEKDKVKLVLVGGCRNLEDTIRVEKLKLLCQKLGVEENVEFKLNLSFSDLKTEMAKATIGIHTMWNEHFGIGVVESMAAGLIMVAHKSGGPMMDIIVDYQGEQTGYLASDEESYAQCIEEILHLSNKERTKLRTNAREWVRRFSANEFEASFLQSIQQLLSKE